MVPVLPLDCSADTFLQAYARSRAVLLRPHERVGDSKKANARKTSSRMKDFGLKQLHKLHCLHPGLLDETYTLECTLPSDSKGLKGSRGRARREEVKTTSSASTAAPTCADALFTMPHTASASSWYVSFLVQKIKSAVSMVLKQVIPHHPISHSRSLSDWIFDIDNVTGTTCHTYLLPA